MTRILLDTTALLAHYLDEVGAERVQQFFDTPDTEILMSAVSVAEFARRLVALGVTPADARERSLAYAGLCDSVVPVDTAAAVRAFELAVDTPSRVPLVDALIASAALLSDASLVHRDSHFAAITAVPQIELAPAPE